MELEAKKDFRYAIMKAQDVLMDNEAVLKGKDLDALCPVIHTFTPGIYVRQIFIPAGVLLIGKIHKHEHPSFLMSGEVLVITERGKEHFKDPLSMVSPAGTKRFVMAITDTIWITVHSNKDDETDLDKIEDYVIAKTFEEFDEFKRLEASKELT